MSHPVVTTTFSFRRGVLQRLRRELGYNALPVEMPWVSVAAKILKGLEFCECSQIWMQLQSASCKQSYNDLVECSVVGLVVALAPRERERELLSLVGTLQHAALVFKAGICFLRRLIDLSCRVKRLHYWVRLNVTRQQMYCGGMPCWSCEMACALYLLCLEVPTLRMSLFALGLWGCGAV